MTKKARNTVVFSSVAALVLIILLILVFSLPDASKVDTVSCENNMTVINYNNETFYDVSTYGVDKGIYGESDYQRLMNIDADGDSFDDCFPVYYTDNPIAKTFLKENIIVRNLFNNDIIFITSTNDTQLLVKKDIVLPEIEKSNIEKIVVTSVSHDDIVYETDHEINDFADNYDYYFEKYSNELGGFECRLYFKNSDAAIYETVNRQAFSQK